MSVEQWGEEALLWVPSVLSDSQRGHFELRGIPMVAMGNGSIKAPRAEENSCLASGRTDPPDLDTAVLR